MNLPRPTTAPAYVPDPDLARKLGKSLEWFRKNRPTLEAEGFPAKDGLIKLTLMADVEAWIARRRIYADAVQVQPPTSGQVNFDAF